MYSFSWGLSLLVGYQHHGYSPREIYHILFYHQSIRGHLVGQSGRILSRHCGVYSNHSILETIRMERCWHRNDVSLSVVTKKNLWLNSKFGPLMLALPFILKIKATCVFPDNSSGYALDCIIICPKNLDHNYHAVLIYVCYFLDKAKIFFCTY